MISTRSQSTENRKISHILLALIALGFILRLGGIGYGLPYLTHPDEARIILDTLSMGQRISLLPERPDYALLYRYLLLFLYGLYYLLGRIFHLFSGSYDFALKFLINPAYIYILSRFVSVFFGTAIAILAYAFGKNIFKDRIIGVSAATFCLFESQLLQHSQWALYSVIFAFFTLPAFYFMFRSLESPVKKNFYRSALFTGLAISIQNQGIFLIPPLTLTFILAYFSYRKRNSFGGFLRIAAVSMGIFLFFSLLGNFYWLFIFDKSWTKTAELWGVTRVGFSSVAPFRYNILSMFWWFITELVRQDLLLGVLMILGLLYAFIRRMAFDWILIIFVFTYMYFNSKWGFRLLHDTLSLLPIMCIFAARLLGEFLVKIKKRELAFILSLIVVLPLIYDAVRIDMMKTRKDTRIVAKEWVERNLPAGSKIGVDLSVYSVPLTSRIPFLLRNPIAEKYYTANLEPLIGDAYRKYISGKPAYEIDELMYWSEQPRWPKDMPGEVAAQAQAQNVFRDLYSRFVFKDFDKIINKDKVDYIIITSFTWDLFLFDNSPYRKYFHNPFIKDRMYLNYKHSADFIDDKRHGPLFYLVRDGRQFYEALFNDKIADTKLIKTFTPVDNLGPQIMIYQVARNGK